MSGAGQMRQLDDVGNMSDELPSLFVAWRIVTVRARNRRGCLPGAYLGKRGLM